MRVCGVTIQKKRIEKGKEVREVAHAADLSERRIQQIERGVIVNINRNVAKAMAAFLGVKLDDIAFKGGGKDEAISRRV